MLSSKNIFIIYKTNAQNIFSLITHYSHIKYIYNTYGSKIYHHQYIRILNISHSTAYCHWKFYLNNTCYSVIMALKSAIDMPNGMWPSATMASG